MFELVFGIVLVTLAVLVISLSVTQRSVDLITLMMPLSIIMGVNLIVHSATGSVPTWLSVLDTIARYLVLTLMLGWVMFYTTRAAKAGQSLAFAGWMTLVAAFVSILTGFFDPVPSFGLMLFGTALIIAGGGFKPLAKTSDDGLDATPFNPSHPESR